MQKNLDQVNRYAEEINILMLFIGYIMFVLHLLVQVKHLFTIQC